MTKKTYYTKAVYVPGTEDIIDFCTADGETLLYSCAAADLIEKHPGAVLIDGQEAIAQSTAATRARLCKGPKEVTEERFCDMLSVLPPLNWVRGDGAESFRISEFIRGNFTSAFCRIGERYFEMIEDIAFTHDQIVTACAGLAPAKKPRKVYTVWVGIEEADYDDDSTTPREEIMPRVSSNEFATLREANAARQRMIETLED